MVTFFGSDIISSICSIYELHHGFSTMLNKLFFYFLNELILRKENSAMVLCLRNLFLYVKSFRFIFPRLNILNLTFK